MCGALTVVAMLRTSDVAGQYAAMQKHGVGERVLCVRLDSGDITEPGLSDGQEKGSSASGSVALGPSVVSCGGDVRPDLACIPSCDGWHALCLGTWTAAAAHGGQEARPRDLRWGRRRVADSACIHRI